MNRDRADRDRMAEYRRYAAGMSTEIGYAAFVFSLALLLILVLNWLVK